MAVHATAFYGTFIYSVSLTELQVLENAVVGVDETGVIRFIERDVEEEEEGVHDLIMKKKKDQDEKWEVVGVGRGRGRGESRKGRTEFWFPGFVDTHIHASQYPNRGIFGKSTLLDWLNTYTYPLESSLSNLSKARQVYGRCVTSTLSHGTTTASYYAVIDAASTNLLADVCLSKGQRAFIGRCNMDSSIHPPYYVDPSADSAVERTKATIQHIDRIDPSHSLITPIITPRFAPSCTTSLLSQLGSLHRETGLPVQTHISENVAEIELVKEMFPSSASYTSVYDDHGLLTSKTLLAHAVHLSAEEMQLIKEKGAKVSHCPVSNSYISSGLCPVRELLEKGIEVGLGTDVSGGWSGSVLAAAREAGGVSRVRAAVSPMQGQQRQEKMKLSVEECLYLATRGGARCLGLEKKIGGFEVGMEWDAQHVDLGEVVNETGMGGRGGVDLFGDETWEEKVAKWVFCGDDRNTTEVWVKGRMVHRQQ